MTRRSVATLAVVLVAVLVIAVSGVAVLAHRGGEEHPRAGAEDRPTPSIPTGAAATNAADAPEFVPPTGPAPTTAGPLSSADVPEPSVLGSDFTTFVDPGGAEAGWIGNGTFVHGRDAHEAAFGVLPLGCKHRLDVDLPIPAFALQGSYHGPRSRPAQVVLLDFARTPDAASYFDGFTSMLGHCTRPDGPSGVAVRVEAQDATALVGTRTYGGNEVWSEVDVRTGKRVAVLLSSVPIKDGVSVVPSLKRAVAAR